MENEILDQPGDAGQHGSLPVYYSQRVIFWFSFLFSAIFGSILMAMNLKTSSAKTQCIIFGVVYTILVGAILNLLKAPTFVSIITGSLGGFLVNQLFWNRYIGDDAEFTPRSITGPVIVAAILTLVIIGFVVLAVLFSNQLPNQ